MARATKKGSCTGAASRSAPTAPSRQPPLAVNPWPSICVRARRAVLPWSTGWIWRCGCARTTTRCPTCCDSSRTASRSRASRQARPRPLPGYAANHCATRAPLSCVAARSGPSSEGPLLWTILTMRARPCLVPGGLLGGASSARPHPHPSAAPCTPSRLTLAGPSSLAPPGGASLGRQRHHRQRAEPRDPQPQQLSAPGAPLDTPRAATTARLAAGPAARSPQPSRRPILRCVGPARLRMRVCTAHQPPSKGSAAEDGAA
jgi:hypothetical protein